MDDESRALWEILRQLSRAELLIVRAVLLARVHLERTWTYIETGLAPVSAAGPREDDD